jgi:hypothetical protein
MIRAKIWQASYYHSLTIDATVHVRDTTGILVFGRGIHDDFQITEIWQVRDSCTITQLENSPMK